MSKPSIISPLDNIAHLRENTSQAPDLKGLYREMHNIAEQIKIMNENNACLIQHLTTNNPPPSVAPVLEEVDQSCRSYRLGDRESQSHQSTSQACLTRNR